MPPVFYPGKVIVIQPADGHEPIAGKAIREVAVLGTDAIYTRGLHNITLYERQLG